MRITRVLATSCIGVCVGLGAASAGPIYKVVLDDVIHGITAGHVIDTIHAAAEDDAELVLIQLKTPGGLLSATRDMIEVMLNSERPVVVYVAPAGAHAASAGFLITIAADVAVMAPDTNTGAATPVSGTGQDLAETMEKKVVSDAAAYTRSIAERRGRNPEIAEKAVTETLSWTASEALEVGLIDYIASSENELLELLHGKPIPRDGGAEIVLATAGKVDRAARDDSGKQKILAFIANPNVAFLLGLIGLGGLYHRILESRACCFRAFSAPYRAAARGLRVRNTSGQHHRSDSVWSLGFGLLIVEVVTPSFGIIGSGGILRDGSRCVCLLFEEQPLPTPALRVSLDDGAPGSDSCLAWSSSLSEEKCVEAQRRVPDHRQRGTHWPDIATTRTPLEDRGKVFHSW